MKQKRYLVVSSCSKLRYSYIVYSCTITLMVSGLVIKVYLHFIKMLKAIGMEIPKIREKSTIS